MFNNRDQIIERFLQVKALGFVRSNRCNNTGIGKTFEDYIGVIENNSDEPDLYGYEIKSHREEASSFITLFTKCPNFPRGANAYLKDRFGSPYADNPTLKKLHTSMFASKYNTLNDTYCFKLINDKLHGLIRIGVHNDHWELIDNCVGYTYECLSNILNKKLKNLFYVSAERRFVNGAEYFYFNRAEIYSNPTIDKFLSLLDDGLIMFDIRIGCYQSGTKYGKPHDHGSGFRIMESNLKLLYDEHVFIT